MQKVLIFPLLVLLLSAHHGHAQAPNSALGSLGAAEPHYNDYSFKQVVKIIVNPGQYRENHYNYRDTAFIVRSRKENPISYTLYLPKQVAKSHHSPTQNAIVFDDFIKTFESYELNENGEGTMIYVDDNDRQQLINSRGYKIYKYGFIDDLEFGRCGEGLILVTGKQWYRVSESQRSYLPGYWVIDTLGAEVVPFRPDTLLGRGRVSVRHVAPFQNGLLPLPVKLVAWGTDGDSPVYDYSFMNRKGEILEKYVATNLWYGWSNPNHNFINIRSAESGFYGYIDTNGNVKIPFRFKGTYPFDSSNMAWVEDIYGVFKLIDTTGTVLFTVKDTIWGYVNESYRHPNSFSTILNGRILLNRYFSDKFPFGGGEAWGLFNLEGKQIGNLFFTAIKDKGDGNFWAIPYPEATSIDRYDYNLDNPSIEGGWGVINPMGKWLIKSIKPKPKKEDSDSDDFFNLDE